MSADQCFESRLKWSHKKSSYARNNALGTKINELLRPSMLDNTTRRTPHGSPPLLHFSGTKTKGLLRSPVVAATTRSIFPKPKTLFQNVVWFLLFSIPASDPKIQILTSNNPITYHNLESMNHMVINIF